MTFKIDYEHIFFDRYKLSENQKKAEAESILKKIFKEQVTIGENHAIELLMTDAEKEIETEKLIKMLRDEFFLIIEPFYEYEEKYEPDIIEQAEKYIKQNYLYESLCAPKVCEYFEIDRKVLDKAFNERFSKTVTEYIKYVRVEKAKEHIAHGEKLNLVAMLCGFGSVKTMERSFKAVCGKTPGEYR